MCVCATTTRKHPYGNILMDHGWLILPFTAQIVPEPSLYFRLELATTPLRLGAVGAAWIGGSRKDFEPTDFGDNQRVRD